ncbi:M1 family metallopeptidase [Lentzea sp. PSKA42]|uniref:M1 family metallopeptidase n=1 Tax=Lentzea indica TaxID=2604800 RepID=A0ABX1FY85_9PSEU|nr:M1 family metallopeptidase [Lentzea indica]
MTRARVRHSGSRVGAMRSVRKWRPAASLAVIGLMVTSAGAALSEPAGTPFDVAAYDLSIDHDPVDGVLRGSALITARAAADLDALTLHLNGPEVSAVAIDGVAARSFTRSGQDDLAITPAKRINRGDHFRVRVDYAGKPGDGWMPTDSGGVTAFMGASSAWFPIGDEQDRAEFRLTATVPQGWHVVSVGQEQQAGQEQQGGQEQQTGQNTVRWTERDVAPAHIAVSIDKFTVERSKLADGTPVVNAYAPGLRDRTKPLADRLPQIMDFLVSRYGAYPFDAAGNVFVHVNDSGPGTSPQSRPVYLGARSTFMDLLQVVHEQAHQWYGVSASARLSEDACLAECFASHSTWMWEEANDGADLDARYRDLVNAKKTDAAYWQQPLYRPGRTPGFEIYTRGPLALHALHRQIGDESFDRLLVEWPRRNRHSFVSWPQFEQLAGQISGQDLSGFFQAWFRGTTLPADQYLWPGTLRRDHSSPAGTSGGDGGSSTGSDSAGLADVPARSRRHDEQVALHDADTTAPLGTRRRAPAVGVLDVEHAVGERSRVVAALLPLTALLGHGEVEAVRDPVAGELGGVLLADGQVLGVRVRGQQLDVLLSLRCGEQAQ